MSATLLQAAVSCGKTFRYLRSLSLLNPTWTATRKSSSFTYVPETASAEHGNLLKY